MCFLFAMIYRAAKGFIHEEYHRYCIRSSMSKLKCLELNVPGFKYLQKHIFIEYLNDGVVDFPFTHPNITCILVDFIYISFS